jgi:hypothetical protein
MSSLCNLFKESVTVPINDYWYGSLDRRYNCMWFNQNLCRRTDRVMTYNCSCSRTTPHNNSHVFFYCAVYSRILTGVGEASFAGLAPTCIDDIAPLAQRTLWLGIFFCAMPAGAALGYIAGGLFATWHWQFGFLTEGLLMVPFVIITYFVPTIPRGSDGDAETTATAAAERAALIPSDDAASGASDSTTPIAHTTANGIGHRSAANGTGAAGESKSADEATQTDSGKLTDSGATSSHIGASTPRAGRVAGHDVHNFFLDLWDLITNWYAQVKIHCTDPIQLL